MTLQTQKTNFEEKNKLEIESMEDLVTSARATIEKTEKKITEIVSQNNQSKLEKKKDEESIK